MLLEPSQSSLKSMTVSEECKSHFSSYTEKIRTVILQNNSKLDQSIFSNPVKYRISSFLGFGILSLLFPLGQSCNWTTVKPSERYLDSLSEKVAKNAEFPQKRT